LGIVTIFGNADIVFSGGGQDSNQLRIADDLFTRKANIKHAVDKGVVFLTICGTYQLFGHYFKTSENKIIQGISVFDCITEASPVRKIGNAVVEHGIKGLQPRTLVGFENHSGNTYLQNYKLGITNYNNATVPLGKVIRGFGNNGKDEYEGARYKNCFGTYLHGSLLPKNPHFANYLISIAINNKYKHDRGLKVLNEELEMLAHSYILSKTN
jgi:lipid II isoglutaminyl synthase (glutamine-hydrolysing)